MSPYVRSPHPHSPLFHSFSSHSPLSHSPPPPPPPLLSVSPPFPYHTAIGVFSGNFVLSLLCFLTFLQGIDGVPNLYPPSMRKTVTILASSLFGFFLIIHIFTPAGLLPGIIGVSVPFVILAIAGTLPLFLFPPFRNVVQNTPQSYLIGIHTIRCMSYLFLPLFDLGYLPGSYVIPVGWGDTLFGLSAPVMAHVFASTNVPHLKKIGIGWNVVGLVEILMSLACGGAFLDNFLARRMAQNLPVRYLWYTVLLVPRFTYPLLSLMHGYSIWKLFTEKDKPAMIWQDGEIETDSIYEIEGSEET